MFKLPEIKNSERHKALCDKYLHPEKIVICPECGYEIQYYVNGLDACSFCPKCNVTAGERGL